MNWPSLPTRVSKFNPEKFDRIGSWGKCYQTFLSVIYNVLEKARVFVLGKPFKPSLIRVELIRVK
jgi:hypothetical protein